MEAVMDGLVRYGLIVVFAWVCGEQLGLPLPAEPVLLAAGSLIGSGRLDAMAVVLVAALGSLLSDTIWYVIGRVGGVRVLGWLCRISLEPDSCVKRTQNVFGRHGSRSLVVAKFIPGFNTVAPPLAGIVRMPLHEFVLFSALGALLWAGAFIGVGYVFSAQLEIALRYLDELGGWAIVLVVVAAAAYVGFKYVSRQRFLRKIRIARITPEDLKARLDRGEPTVVVDVRDRVDFTAEPAIIPGALHLAIDELDERHHEIPRDRDVVLYCT